MEEINKGYKNDKLISTIKEYSQLNSSFYGSREYNDYMATTINNELSVGRFVLRMRKEDKLMDYFYQTWNLYHSSYIEKLKE